MKNILVVGGAGYIGSHMVLTLLENGYNPVTYDNLSEGHRDAILGGDFVEGDISDSKKLKEVFSNYKIEAVMHFAASCYVGESMTNPQKYYQNNVVHTFNLLNEMLLAKIDKFIFSSTCATYGVPQKLPLTEDHPQNPINTYGTTKLMIEKILRDYDRAYGLKNVCLRYFNASGADPKSRIGERHDPETHLIPNVLDSVLGIKTINVFGNDYDTTDGTCVRDYIHILDLAQAHLLALEKLFAGNDSNFYNLGNGEGHSIMQIIKSVEEVTGKKVPYEISGRRPGDPPTLVGSSKKAKAELGWEPKYFEINQIIQTAWDWHKKLKNIA